MAQISKILYIITQAEQGGAQKYVADLSKAFHGENLEVIVAAGEQGMLLEDVQKYGIQTKVLRNLQREIHPIKDILALCELYFFIRKTKPDIVHLNSSKAGVLGAVAAKLARVKNIVYTAHGFVFLEPMPQWKKMFYIFAEKLSGYYKNTIICVSDHDKAMAIRYAIVPEKKCVTVYHGIDVQNMRNLQRADARDFFLKTYGIDMSRYTHVAGTIANLYPTKGLRYLVEATHFVIQKYPKMLFVIIGEGQDRHKLEVLIAQKNLQSSVKLIGRVSCASQYLSAFDVFVLPSVKEGFPYVILEAMAARVPVVSTRVGGIPEMLEENAGMITEPNNTLSLSKGIQKILSDPVLEENVKNNAYAKVKNNFSLERMLAKTKSVYSRLI